MIGTTINGYGFDEVSELSIKMGYRITYAAYMRLEGPNNVLSSRIDADLTQKAGIYMGDDILRENDKGPKPRRRTNSKK